MEYVGVIEKKVRQKIRRTAINKAVIGVIALAGILAVGAVAPNVLGAMGKLGILGAGKKGQGVRRSISRLVENGYVAVEGGRVSLTPKGEKFAALIGEGRLAPKKSKRWDGKWRVLIFDIPERRKELRDHVRWVLTSLGFVKLQGSVWVYPYDCEDIITTFKIDRHVGRSMLYMIVDRIEDDKHLRHIFGLGLER